MPCGASPRPPHNRARRPSSWSKKELSSMRTTSRWPVLVLFGLLVTAWLTACGKDDAINQIRDQQRLILAKLTAREEKIDKAAARPAAPPRASVPDPARAFNLPVGNSPTKGPADAPIT